MMARDVGILSNNAQSIKTRVGYLDAWSTLPSGPFSTGNISFYFEFEGAKKKMEKQLTDLVLALNLSREQVEEIRAIVGHSDWKERFMLYLLALYVQKQGEDDLDLTLEDLGYKRVE